MGEVLDDVEAMVRRSGDGDDVASDMDADVVADVEADVEAMGLQLLKIGWKAGACGESVVALAWADSPPFARRSILEGQAGYYSSMEPFFNKVQMVAKGTVSSRSASEVESSQVESDARKVSSLLSRWVQVVLLIALRIMSFAS